MSIVLERIETIEQLESDATWWQIYFDAFPPPYQVKKADLLRAFSHPMVRFFRGRRDGRTVAMITSQLLVNPSALFIGYFAVARSERGQGTGPAILADCLRQTYDELRALGHQPLGTILEVELAATPDKRSHAESWFRKQGMEPLPIGYRQPPLGGYPAIPMRLLFKSVAEGLALTPTAQLALVRGLLEQKYKVSYGVSEEAIAEELRLSAESVGIGPASARALLKSS